VLGQSHERGDVRARVTTIGQVHARAQETLTELLNSPVGELVQAETVGEDAVGVVLIVRLDELDVALENAEAEGLELGAGVLLA
jgi:hypothetical protein